MIHDAQNKPGLYNDADVQDCVQAYVIRELGNCEIEHVACGSGLERIYRFLQSDELCNRPDMDLQSCKVTLALADAHCAPRIILGLCRPLSVLQWGRYPKSMYCFWHRMLPASQGQHWTGVTPWQLRLWICSWQSSERRQAIWDSEPWQQEACTSVGASLPRYLQLVDSPGLLKQCSPSHPLQCPHCHLRHLYGSPQPGRR